MKEGQRKGPTNSISYESLHIQLKFDTLLRLLRLKLGLGRLSKWPGSRRKKVRSKNLKSAIFELHKRYTPHQGHRNLWGHKDWSLPYFKDCRNKEKPFFLTLYTSFRGQGDEKIELSLIIQHNKLQHRKQENWCLNNAIWLQSHLLTKS